MSSYAFKFGKRILSIKFFLNNLAQGPELILVLDNKQFKASFEFKYLFPGLNSKLTYPSSVSPRTLQTEISTSRQALYNSYK